VRERELRRARELVRTEPAQLGEVIARPGLAAPSSRPGEAEDDPAVVRLEPETEKLDRLDLERRLLPDFAPQRVEGVLVLVQEAAGQVPEPLAGIEGAAPEQDATELVEAHCLGARDRVRVGDIAAGSAFHPVVELLDSLAADGTEAPTVECAHGPDNMSPRAAGATQHELSRIGLLATLPGETLARLAQRMTREDIPAGAGVVEEGEDGERFYVVLNGMLTVSQRSRGPQSVLRPGDYFGEVALAMHMPRTASVRALTPVTVASCNRETFDEFVRPLFADDE
jgi:Cyclic nucleotide-binding domain